MKALLVCVGGLSTSQIATKLTELGEKNGDYFEATSVISSDWSDKMNEFDLIMVSPQTSFRYDAVVKEVKEYGVGQKVYQMKPENYILNKSEVIYAEVKKFMKK